MEEISKKNSEEIRICGEAYDINKQTIYIVPISKIESRAHYAPEPAWGVIKAVLTCMACRTGGTSVHTHTTADTWIYLDDDGR